MMQSGRPAAVLLLLLAGAAQDPAGLLHSLMGQDRATVETRIGPPDDVESNGVQTFLRYRDFDAWRTGSAPDPFGYAQGYAGGRGFRGSASFDCLTTLVFVEDALRGFYRSGIGCRR